MPWDWLAGWGCCLTPDLFNPKECCRAGACIVEASPRSPSWASDESRMFPGVLFQLILLWFTLHPGLEGRRHGPNGGGGSIWRPLQGRLIGEPCLTFTDETLNHVDWSKRSEWLHAGRRTDGGGSRQMHRPDKQLLPRYVLYTHLGLVRGNGRGGVYDVIKMCQKRSAWEQVVCGAAAIKVSRSFGSLPQIVTPQTEHYWLGARANIQIPTFASSRTENINFRPLQNCRGLFSKMSDKLFIPTIRIKT